MKYYFKIIDNKIDSSYAFNEIEIKTQFPELDLSINIPEGYIQYKPYSNMFLNPYEKINILGYDYIDDNTVTDIVEIVPMTLEEKKQKQENVKNLFYSKTKRYSWVLNEEKCVMAPPFFPPNDEWTYRWDENTQTYINMNITKEDHLKQSRAIYANKSTTITG